MSATAWGDPEPLETRRAVPDFPVSAFPDWLAAWVSGVSGALEVPSALPGVLGLVVVAMALARRFVVEPRTGWREPLNLFGLVVLDPANRKSAAFSEATAPLVAFERDAAERLGPEIARAQSDRGILERRQKRAAENAARADDAGTRADATREAGELAEELARTPVPTVPRLFVSGDVTPERLAGLLAEQQGRVAVMDPEGGLFAILAGRYSEGGSNLDTFLKGHAGDPLRVERVGRPPDVVERPALTVGLTVQHDVLRGLAARPDFRGRGLVGRFLFAMPESPLGSRRGPFRAPELPEAVRAAYADHVRALLEIEPSEDGAARVLTFAKDARDRLQALHEELEPELGPGRELAHMSDWGGKLLGATVRLSGVLFAASRLEGGDPRDRTVDGETFARAVELARFFRAHAEAVYAELGADPALDNPRRVLAWVGRHGRATVTVRDVFNGLRGARFPKVEALRPALEALAERGYLRPLPRQERDGPGRAPSPAYEVHPTLLAASGDA